MQDLFAKQLEALRAASLDRHLREISSSQAPEIEIEGRRLLNFSSNDYLGLANDSRLRNAAIDAINEFGVGAGASRLISGTQSPHVRLERVLAKWKGTDAALCFSSGYAAALGTIPALVTKNDVVLLDKLCHASLIDGAKLSGASLRIFPHNNLRKLERHLEWARREHAGKGVLIVTESVFSMDGDRAPLRELVKLKKKFGALLMLDESARRWGDWSKWSRPCRGGKCRYRSRCSDGHVEQGAGRSWRIHLRHTHAYGMVYQPCPFLHLFHSAAARDRRDGPGCSEFSFIFRRRETEASGLEKNPIDARASYEVGHWKFGVGRSTFRGR
jgi:hypothetical protein